LAKPTFIIFHHHLNDLNLSYPKIPLAKSSYPLLQNGHLLLLRQSRFGPRPAPSTGKAQGSPEEQTSTAAVKGGTLQW
jgi:hypothetical protein